jgi:hypothetical protein
MSDNDPMHQQLLGHLLGALDDDEQEWVDARLEGDESLRREYTELRRRLTPLLTTRPDYDPPPGLADETCRLVASFAPAPRHRETPRRTMSPDLALSSRSNHASWLDVAAVAMVVAVFGILVPPALHAGRFHSRLASCQDGLRQVGLALSLYGYHHGNDLSALADNERLTTAGQFVADLLDSRLAPDDGRTICPEAWLAAQGVFRWPPHMACWRDGIEGGLAEVAEPSDSLPSGTWAHLAKLSNLNWSGVERNGTIDGSTDSPPAAVALLADAPSADSPDQALDYHDGQGRNRFFEDGHVDFLPCSTPRDTAEAILPRDDVPATPNVTVPVRFAGWH